MLGQVPDLSGALAQALGQGNLIPPGTIYVGLTTPIGNAYVDPFAAAQDPVTQRVLQGLGIGVTFGIGPAPTGEAAGPSLGDNLKVLALVAVGGLVLWMVLRR